MAEGKASGMCNIFLPGRKRKCPIILPAHFADSEYGGDALVHSAAEHMLRYLHSTVKADLTHINRLTRIAVEKFMNLDATAIRNLELVKNMRDGTKRGTLLDVLDLP